MEPVGRLAKRFLKRMHRPGGMDRALIRTNLLKKRAYAIEAVIEVMEDSPKRKTLAERLEKINHELKALGLASQRYAESVSKP